MAETYEGRPCKHCKGTLRYSAGRHCVPCKKKDYNGRRKGMTDTYRGNPCKRGHDGLRYSASRTCVTCANTRDKTRKRFGVKKRAPIRTSKLAGVFALQPRVAGLREFHEERRGT